MGFEPRNRSIFATRGEGFFEEWRDAGYASQEKAALPLSAGESAPDLWGKGSIFSGKEVILSNRRRRKRVRTFAPELEHQGVGKKGRMCFVIGVPGKDREESFSQLKGEGSVSKTWGNKYLPVDVDGKQKVTLERACFEDQPYRKKLYFKRGTGGGGKGGDNAIR